MARGERLGAFALSEPEAGSDAAALRCQARRDGDDWILDGTKSWVTSGSHAGVILVMARTDTALGPNSTKRSMAASMSARSLEARPRCGRDPATPCSIREP